MTARFYIATFDGRRPPATLAGHSYIQIKGHFDGTPVAIISTEAISATDVTEVDQATLQATLNSWIDAENVSPPTDPITGSQIIQPYIDLAVFL